MNGTRLDHYIGVNIVPAHGRQRKILEEAAQIGDAMGRVMLFDGPDRFRQVGEGLGAGPFAGAKWHWVFQVNPVQNRYLRPDR